MNGRDVARCSRYPDHSLAARLTGGFFLLLLLGGCASGVPRLPYPAFQPVSGLPEVFLAELPGTRARLLSADAATRDGFYRVDLPAAWRGSSGASPGKSMELFVLAGRLSLGREFELGPGGYAYLPSGSLGFNLDANDGVRVLIRLQRSDADAVIRTPIILDSGLMAWTELLPGVEEKELRFDPGSRERTTLRRFSVGRGLPWFVSLSATEGYLVSGDMTLAECVGGEARSGPYPADSYVSRPADVPWGGPDAEVAATAVWFMHQRNALGETTDGDCS